jgi:hypothetical protein
MNPSRYNLLDTLPSALFEVAGVNLLRHIQVNATRSAKLDLGRRREIKKAAVPETATQKTPKRAMSEITESSFAT